MQESPEIFLSVLERIFPNKLDAQNQFEKDKRRNRLQVMREKENLNLALSSLEWIDLIEQQIIHPHLEIPISSVSSMNQK